MVWLLSASCVLTLSACGRFSFNEKEQHLYDCASRVQSLASNPQAKMALIQSKMSSQMMDKTFGMIGEVREQARAQPNLPAAPAWRRRTATGGSIAAPAAQQLVSQYPQADANSPADKKSPEPAVDSATEADQAQMAQLQAAHEKQLQAFKTKFSALADMGSMQTKLQEAMTKDMTASDLARGIAEQDRMMRGMKDKMAKLGPDAAPQLALSMIDVTINQAMPTHIYYVTPELPWSITVSGDDAKHKIICKGFGDDLHIPKFTDEYDMTWK